MNVIKKKLFKRILLTFSIVFILSGIATYFCFKYIPIASHNKPLKEINKEYIVSVEGAVEAPGDYKFDKPLTLREILFHPSLKTNADTSTIDLEEVINKDYSIFVPFQLGAIQKIKWSEITSINQLIDRGIKKSTAKKIIDFKRKNNNPTWEQIHAIKGIGKITLNQLKEVIELT